MMLLLLPILAFALVVACCRCGWLTCRLNKAKRDRLGSDAAWEAAYGVVCDERDKLRQGLEWALLSGGRRRRETDKRVNWSASEN